MSTTLSKHTMADLLAEVDDLWQEAEKVAGGGVAVEPISPSPSAVVAVPPAAVTPQETPAAAMVLPSPRCDGGEVCDISEFWGDDDDDDDEDDEDDEDCFEEQHLSSMGESRPVVAERPAACVTSGSESAVVAPAAAAAAAAATTTFSASSRAEKHEDGASDHPCSSKAIVKVEPGEESGPSRAVLIRQSITGLVHEYRARVRDVPPPLPLPPPDLNGDPLTTVKRTRRHRPDLRVCFDMLKDITERRPIGNVDGVTVGDIFGSRAELAVLRLHATPRAGMDFERKAVFNGDNIAVAVVMMVHAKVSCYGDDSDDGEVVVYSGQGGFNQKTGTYEDQKLQRGNLGLSNAHRHSTPVRLIRGYRLEHGQVYSYDGLYRVEQVVFDIGVQGKMVYKFRLKRMKNQKPLKLLTMEDLRATRRDALDLINSDDLVPVALPSLSSRIGIGSASKRGRGRPRKLRGQVDGGKKLWPADGSPLVTTQPEVNPPWSISDWSHHTQAQVYWSRDLWSRRCTLQDLQKQRQQQQQEPEMEQHESEVPVEVAMEVAAPPTSFGMLLESVELRAKQSEVVVQQQDTWDFSDNLMLLDFPESDVQSQEINSHPEEQQQQPMNLQEQQQHRQLQPMNLQHRLLLPPPAMREVLSPAVGGLNDLSSALKPIHPSGLVNLASKLKEVMAPRPRPNVAFRSPSAILEQKPPSVKIVPRGVANHKQVAFAVTKPPQESPSVAASRQLQQSNASPPLPEKRPWVFNFPPTDVAAKKRCC